MAKVILDKSSLVAIANAIRAKHDTDTQYLPSEMASAIANIDGYPEPTGTVNVTQNGTVNVKDYETADVNVSINFAVTDEGKVVVEGELVAQESLTITEEGTYDTTTVNEVIVAIAEEQTEGE